MLIKEKLLLLIFTVTEIISAPQDALSDKEIAPLEVSRAYKNYNHPPLFEILDVPDSEDLEIRKVRQAPENLDSLVRNNSLQPKKINTGIYHSRTPYVESSYPEKIPVTVFYDPEPAPQRGNNKVNSTVVKVKRRKQQKNSQPSNNVNKSEAIPEEKKVQLKIPEIVTERIPITSPAPRTVVPKTFTKRPPEDNPVFKKIRQRDPVVKIVDETNFVFSHSGNFHFSFEGGDGTKVSSQGELRSFDGDKTGEAVIGSVFYKDDEGNDVNLSYTADENGYRPHGAHLPTPPPIPPAIARALKYLATATTPEPVTKPTTKKKN